MKINLKMNRFQGGKNQIVFFLIPLFVFSFLNIPVPSEAALNLPSNHFANNSSQNSLASPLEEFLMPADVVRADQQIQGERVTLVMDSKNTSRIYQFTEISSDRTLTLRYFYDDYNYRATLLFSVVAKGKIPVFSRYYRYSLGPQDSLENLLEEGWTKEGTLIPARLYDYAQGHILIRSFDRTGTLLKIESTAGFKRILIYSREGKLLTIQDVNEAGLISFYDQISNSKFLELPLSYSHRPTLSFILPNREKDKRLITAASVRGLNIRGEPPLMDKGVLENFVPALLNWLEAAHPLRAGPAGGLML